LTILDTGVKYARNVGSYTIGSGSISELRFLLDRRRALGQGYVVFFVDDFFKNNEALLGKLAPASGDEVLFVSTIEEPTVQSIDEFVSLLRSQNLIEPCAIVGVGGGIAMDTAKAVANLLTNPGSAASYQGWDLVTNPAVYKIAIPTISGTGAEATRTCVMTNKDSGLKLGMNSDHTVYDQVILDPDLTITVPREQYFYTGMDAYIHCIESLSGSYRNPIGDAFSQQTIQLCREVFGIGDMMAAENRSKLMVASYLGGCAIATSYVGLVHPLSAGLSVVMGYHHCVANCIAMRAVEEFYPAYFSEFWRFAETQEIDIPAGVCVGLSDEKFDALFNATVVHEKPLTNALGEGFRRILSKEKVVSLFQKM